MDRRQRKSRDAIYSAFAQLLKKKPFHAITVQEIIDGADIGRTTFYAHFETKEMLLESLCSDMFEHIFDTHLVSEDTHDFSNSSNELRNRLIHILYHVREDKHGAMKTLCTNSGDLFMQHFMKYIRNLFFRYTNLFPETIPMDFMLNLLTGSFAEAVRWWIASDMADAPEAVISYYMSALHFLPPCS